MMNPWLRALFFRAVRLASSRLGGALPCFVADPLQPSDELSLKNSTRAIRSALHSHALLIRWRNAAVTPTCERRRYAAMTGGSAPSSEELARLSGAKPLQRNAEFVRKSRLALEMFELMGFPTLVAPGEAEQTCAQLDRAGTVDACVTPDGDALCWVLPPPPSY